MKKQQNDWSQSITLGITIIIIGTIFYIFAINFNTKNKFSAISIESKKPEIVKPIHNKPVLNCKKVKCIALTFDDGPGLFENKIINSLNKYNAKATYFLLGGAVKARPNYVKKMVQHGFEIGCHTWDHKLLTSLSANKIKWEVNKTNKLIYMKTGYNVQMIRTPYGITNKRVRKILKKLNLPIIKWNIDANDWKIKSTPHVYNVAVHSAHRNGIILFHSIYKSTVNAVPKILKKLKQKGYHFATISELYGNQLKPGKEYS